MINGVLAADIDSVWAMVKPAIARAHVSFDPGFDAEHIRRRLKERELQLWLCNGGEGVCITEIKVMQEFKIFAFQILAGKNMDDWLAELLETGEAFAKHHDCKYLEVFGRKGWLRELKPFGWKPHAIITRKEIK